MEVYDALIVNVLEMRMERNNGTGSSIEWKIEKIWLVKAMMNYGKYIYILFMKDERWNNGWCLGWGSFEFEI